MRKFTDGVLWGTSTSSYQIEGAWNEDGKGESIWDRFCHTPGHIKNGDTGDVANDHYHLWEKDFDLMQSLGLKNYRFSVSWPRIYPKGWGEINPKGIDFYSRQVDGLLKRGITPVVTLYHWDLPQSIQDAGGWLNRRTTDWYAEYAATLVKALGDRVKMFVTINEPNVVSDCCFELGIHAPGVKDPATARQVLHHVLLGHGKALKSCRAARPGAKLGIAPTLSMEYPETQDPRDVAMAQQRWEESNDWQIMPFLKGKYPEATWKRYEARGEAPLVAPGDMEIIRGPLDFLCDNHYWSHFHGHDAQGHPTTDRNVKERTDLGWPIYPDSMRDHLLKLTEMYGKMPIYISENGACYYDTVGADGKDHDEARVNFYRRYITSLHQAIEKGVDIRGYFAWSFMDNFEWAEGYNARFGMIHVDFKTQKRTPKDSMLFYSEVVKNNGL
jgi:beta-glucosidase